MVDDSSIRVRKKRGREGIEEREKKRNEGKGKKKKDKIENKQNCPATITTTDFSYSKPTTSLFWGALLFTILLFSILPLGQECMKW